VSFQGQAINRMSASQRHTLRNRSFGFVFQLYHLLPELSVLENVMLPAMVAAPTWKAVVRARPRKRQALDLLERGLRVKEFELNRANFSDTGVCLRVCLRVRARAGTLGVKRHACSSTAFTTMGQ
jgi:ABC-type lipoprotein export system ATPase subunit